MQTRSQNSLSNTLQICVYEAIRVADVFGPLKRIFEFVMKAASFGFTLGKIKQFQALFANLNNHSSPPLVYPMELLGGNY